MIELQKYELVDWWNGLWVNWFIG